MNEIDNNKNIIIIMFIILGIVIMLYLLIKILLNTNKNPTKKYTKSPKSKKSEKSVRSIVTHSLLGKRGDTGNQIFQIACVVAAAKRSNAKVVLPAISKLAITNMFNLEKYPQKNIIIDKSFHEYDNYEKIIIPEDGKTYDIRGYRQAYKYFEDCSEDIRELFTPKQYIIDTMRKILPKKYIAVHIRKGDYIKMMHNVPPLREFKICKLEYYKQGIKRLKKDYPDYPVLVCTDSPDFVKPLLKQLGATLSPSCKKLSPKISDFCTMYLSDALIISNSTFSWWSAYLRTKRKIICPTPWWDPSGVIGNMVGLDGPYLHYPKWTLLDSETGRFVRGPYGKKGNRKVKKNVPDICRFIRGMVV